MNEFANQRREFANQRNFANTEASPTTPRGASHFQIYPCQAPNGGFARNLWTTYELSTDLRIRPMSAGEEIT
jgi:hypothetical protein